MAISKQPGFSNKLQEAMASARDLKDQRDAYALPISNDGDPCRALERHLQLGGSDIALTDLIHRSPFTTTVEAGNFVHITKTGRGIPVKRMATPHIVHSLGLFTPPDGSTFYGDLVDEIFSLKIEYRKRVLATLNVMTSRFGPESVPREASYIIEAAKIRDALKINLSSVLIGTNPRVNSDTFRAKLERAGEPTWGLELALTFPDQSIKDFDHSGGVRRGVWLDNIAMGAPELIALAEQVKNEAEGGKGNDGCQTYNTEKL